MKLVTVRQAAGGEVSNQANVQCFCLSSSSSLQPQSSPVLEPHILGGAELHCETIRFHYITLLATACLLADWLFQKYKLSGLVFGCGNFTFS